MIGMSGSGAKRQPRRIVIRPRMAVGTCLADGGNWTPERVLSFPVPTGYETVGHDHVHQRIESCGLVQVVLVVLLKDTGDAAPRIVWRLEPEVRDVRLVCR